MKKKVLILTTISGFLPQFLKGHVRILKELGAEIWYASNFDCPAYDFEPDYFEKEGIRTVSVPIERSPYRLRENAAALKKLVALIEREEIDLIHCHNPVGGILGRLAGALAKRKVQVMYTAHGLHFYKGAPWKNWLLYYPAEWLMARFTDHLVTINREDRERAARLPVKPGGAVHLIPGVGVDEERYQPRKELRREVRSELGVGKEEVCLMTSALLHPDKNYQTVLKALAGLGSLPFRYVICGEGPYRSRLWQMTEELGLQEKVTFLGFRKDMDRLLNGADIFLFPSRREGLGMAALEALASGVPVIAAKNRGTGEYLVHGENGFLLSPEDAEGFREAIRTLAEDARLRQAMGERAPKVLRTFGKKEAERRIRKIYRLALAEAEERRKWDAESECDHECLQPEESLPFGAFCPLDLGPDLE